MVNICKDRCRKCNAHEPCSKPLCRRAEPILRVLDFCLLHFEIRPSRPFTEWFSEGFNLSFISQGKKKFPPVTPETA